ALVTNQAEARGIIVGKPGYTHASSLSASRGRSSAALLVTLLAMVLKPCRSGDCVMRIKLPLTTVIVRRLPSRRYRKTPFRHTRIATTKNYWCAARRTCAKTGRHLPYRARPGTAPGWIRVSGRG